MHKIPILILLVFGTKPYNGPIMGDVRNANFSFSHISDWKSSQIVNIVQNDHTKGLVVFWPEGGVTAPEERPIPPMKSDSNKSFCPDEVLDQNLSAQLFYGLSHTSKTAGVYRITQPTKTAGAMNSEIVASTVGEAIRLSVVSTPLGNEFVEYTFEQNKRNYFALSVPSGLLKYFEAAGLPGLPNAFNVLKFSGLPLRKQITNSEGYTLFKPTGLKSTVKIPVTSFQARRLLLFIADSDMRLLASGFVSLHVPPQ